MAKEFAGKGENIVLWYRDLSPNLSRRLYDHLPKNPHKTLRFSASYQTRNRWCSKGQIFIEALNGKIFAIQTNLRGTIDHIKQIAADMQGLNVKDVALSYAGRCLSDGCCLSRYGIRRNSSLRQHARVRGGFALMSGKVFADVSRLVILLACQLIMSSCADHYNLHN